MRVGSQEAKLKNISIMKQMEFGSMNLEKDSQKEFISLDRMLSVFQIYQSCSNENYYLLLPKPEQTAEQTPLIHVNNGKDAELVLWDDQPKSEYCKLKRKVLYQTYEKYEEIESKALPEEVRNSLLSLLSKHFEYKEENDEI